MSFKKLDDESDNNDIKSKIKTGLFNDVVFMTHLIIILLQIPAVIIINITLFFEVNYTKIIIVLIISYAIIILSKIITNILLILYFKNLNSNLLDYTPCFFITNLVINLILIVPIIIKLYINYEIITVVEVSLHSFLFITDMFLLILTEYYDKLKVTQKKMNNTENV